MAQPISLFAFLHSSVRSALLASADVSSPHSHIMANSNASCPMQACMSNAFPYDGRLIKKFCTLTVKWSGEMYVGWKNGRMRERCFMVVVLSAVPLKIHQEMAHKFPAITVRVENTIPEKVLCPVFKFLAFHKVVKIIN